MIQKVACPRCDSINHRTITDYGQYGRAYKGYGCGWCGLLFYESEAKTREFAGEKKKRAKKLPEPYLFPELETK